MTRTPKTPAKATPGTATRHSAQVVGLDGTGDDEPDSSNTRPLTVHIVRGDDEEPASRWLDATWAPGGLTVDALIAQAADAVAKRLRVEPDALVTEQAASDGPTVANARAAAAPIAAAEAAIALSHDAEVAVLNHMFRGIDKPTNVLSFPAPPVRRRAELTSSPRAEHALPAEPNFLGDIALAEETILREAAELGIPPHHHLQHLVVHGLLHLLEFDHDTDAAAASMERLETAILATIGVPDPYAGSDPVEEPSRDSTPR